MDPIRGNREILVSNKDKDLSSVHNYQTSTQARPMPSKGSKKPVQDDINKLFEAINIRTSKSLDLSDHSSSGLSRKNASKRPMRVVPSYASGIGFSEPVSLKQALRGLCISQAGEMAAKRLLKSPGSPRILNCARNSSMHRSIVVETVESGIPLTEGREGMIEITLVPEESPSGSLASKPGNLKEPKARLANQNFHSSTDWVVKPDMKSVTSLEHKVIPSESSKVPTQSLGAGQFEQVSGESKIKSPHYISEPKDSSQSQHHIVPAPLEVGVQSLGTTATQKGNQTLNLVLRDHSISPSSPNRKVGTSTKVASKANPKLRRKAKLPTVSSSIAVKISKERKSIRSTSRAVKPAIRNKNLVLKKQKQEQVITGSNSKSSGAVDSSGYSSNQLVCHKCHCHLKDIKKEPDKDFLAPFNNTKAGAVAALDSKTFDTSKQGYLLKGSGHAVTTASKGSKAPKVREKGEFSQSSKSSIGEFSTSTSVSDDSNVSGSSCGNRPHMSKDFRWEAINNVRKKHGILGLQHFNLLKKLGSGDIGTVYLAELVGTNCPFAIKVMDNEFLERRKKMPRARTEREILRMLDHPFLPTLYAQFTSGNLSCLVMEFCPGGDLHVLRQKQPGRCFPEQEARFYVAEVLLALEYLHMLGIVYRDLKPENILVREDGHIMLTDFDLSLRCSVNPTLLKSSSLGIEPPRISGPCAGSNCIDPFCAGPSCKVSCFTPRIFPASAARTRRLKAEQAAQARSLPQLVAEPTEARSNSFVGTHEYLAPEIIKGEGHGSAVDWWTLGIFLYELMFGKTPFRGPGNEETLANVVLQSLRFPNSPIISFQARDLIRGLLVKEPENRLGTETGAAEIKRHPFFDGLNWALIRCTIPPQIPELCDVGLPKVTMQEKGKGFLECSATGEHLEFELF